MIVATAGHVDHGKTSLVKQLTGVDTDRLPDEKKRGMSIDLGFAYKKINDQISIGYVDVPGHENFIQKNNLIEGYVLEYFIQTYYLNEVYCPSSLVIGEPIQNKQMIERALSELSLIHI